MRGPDFPKSIRMVAALAMLSGAVACQPKPSNEVISRISKTPVQSTATVEPRFPILSDSEFLQPVPLRGSNQMAVFDYGAIINFTPGVRIRVDPSALNKLLSSSEYGVQYSFQERVVIAIHPIDNVTTLIAEEGSQLLNDAKLKLALNRPDIIPGKVGIKFYGGFIRLGDVFKGVVKDNPYVLPDSLEYRSLATAALNRSLLSAVNPRLHRMGSAMEGQLISPEALELLKQYTPLSIQEIHPRYIKALRLASKSD